ncbi:MAG: Flp pilus assembly complex ATPase component TadA [Lentisphaerae bacterium]|nr:Flp pilus assembly complex ATPase component TadA [Lentisphaerota bacterium]
MPDALGKVLVQKGLLTQEQLEEALRISRESFRPLFTVLADLRFTDETGIYRAVADHYGMEYVDLSDTAIDDSAVKALSPKLASHYHVMPTALEGGVLTLAVSNPLDMSAVEDIETNLGYRVDRVLARRPDIGRAISERYGIGADTVERILSDTPDREELIAVEESHDLEQTSDDASVVRLVNQLLHEAIKDRATDIHLEIERDNVTARRRIDGVLYETSLPRNIRLLYPAMVSRIKLMSGLNIVERRLPQDGRSRVKIGREQYDLRVSIVPSVHGEDIVVRILPAAMLFDLRHLGLSETHCSELEALIAKPHGIILVTGPTGSGKSTTLYACISRLNGRERKIITIEDPVEYELAGITQTQINPRIGLTFARALRSMLRHDPDIMMVGEIRDAETAEIAIQTAMTGHLVFSTLHTNDAAAGAVRLVDMGIDPYLITSTVLAFTAQRLVRVICSSCREEIQVEGETRYRAAGCKHCNGTGYHGRIAISEILPLVPGLRQLVLDRASAQAIREKANELGMVTLAVDGRDKVARGITTPEEVLRVTSM